MKKKKLAKETYTTRIAPKHRAYLNKTTATLKETRLGTTSSDLLYLAIEDMMKLPREALARRLEELDRA